MQGRHADAYGAVRLCVHGREGSATSSEGGVLLAVQPSQPGPHLPLPDNRCAGGRQGVLGPSAPALRPPAPAGGATATGRQPCTTTQQQQFDQNTHPRIPLESLNIPRSGIFEPQATTRMTAQQLSSSPPPCSVPILRSPHALRRGFTALVSLRRCRKNALYLRIVKQRSVRK